MPFKFIKTHIPEVTIIKPEVFRDNRGMFMESYRKSDFERAGIDVNFVQDNRSESLKGVLRGLHYQLEPKAQGKLVTCIKGRVFDVAVDLRKSSPGMMPDEMLKPVRRIVGSGNALRKNELLRDSVEEVFKIPLVVPDSCEEAARGAAGYFRGGLRP